MKIIKRTKKIAAVMVLLQLCSLCVLSGCAARGEIRSQTNGNTGLCVEVTKYTGCFTRTIAIKNTQNGTFYVKFSPLSGNIEVSLTDGNGDTILSMNERATLMGEPAVTEVVGGNGTYKLTIQLRKYSGAFDISWDVRG